MFVRMFTNAYRHVNVTNEKIHNELEIRYFNEVIQELAIKLEKILLYLTKT